MSRTPPRSAASGCGARVRTPRRRARRGVERAHVDSALDLAQRTRATRAGIATLSSAHAAAVLQAALDRALEAGHADAASMLALALAAGSHSIPAAAALQLIPLLERLEYVPIVVRASDAEPLDLMEEALALREQTIEQDAVMASIAVSLFAEGKPTARWLALLRGLCLDALPGDDASLILGRALESIAGDVGADPHVHAAREWNAQSTWIARHFAGSVLEVLPELPPPTIVADGFTLRRGEDAKIGRNDPCPCGSGKKYKKCCAAKDSEPGARQPLLDSSRLQPADVARMRPRELLSLDREKLREDSFVEYLQQLAVFHRWSDTETAMARFDERFADEAATTERMRLVQRALAAGALDVAARAHEKLPASAQEDPTLSAAWIVARPDAESISRLAEFAHEALLSGEREWLLDVAYALLDHAPALGIVFARGCVHALEPRAAAPDAKESASRSPAPSPATIQAETDALLSEISRARADLGLDEEDVAHQLVVGLELLARRSRADKAAAAKVERSDERARTTLEETRTHLREERERADSVSAELARVRIEVDRARAAGAIDPATLEEERRAARLRLEESEEDRRVLRARIDEFKSLLKEGAEERAELRKDLKRVAALQDEREAPAPAPQPEEAPAVEPEEAPRQAIRVPSIHRNAADALLAMTPKLARGALDLVAALCAGDAIAWRGAKRMQALDDVWSARVGIHHRVLFRIAGESVEVLELVTREGLDTALMRYRRGA